MTLVWVVLWGIEDNETIFGKLLETFRLLLHHDTLYHTPGPLVLDDKVDDIDWNGEEETEAGGEDEGVRKERVLSLLDKEFVTTYRHLQYALLIEIRRRADRAVKWARRRGSEGDDSNRGSVVVENLSRILLRVDFAEGTEESAPENIVGGTATIYSNYLSALEGFGLTEGVGDGYHYGDLLCGARCCRGTSWRGSARDWSGV